MNVRRCILVIAAVGAASVLTAGSAQAQDPVKVGPHIYKMLFENERVRVNEITFKPGDTIAPHSHPDHFIYVLTPGKLKISKPDGTSNEVEFKAGQVVWIPAETHWAKNIGTTELKALVTELKEPAPKPPAKKEGQK